MTEAWDSRSVSSAWPQPFGWLALRRPGNPEVSTPCQRQPGAEDHSGRVHVGVGLEAAGHAAESRLALTRLSGDVPTSRTGLRCKRGGDGHNRATVLAPMPPQGSEQSAPGFVQDCSIQSCFLSNVASWVPNCAHRRTRHSSHTKVLNCHQAVRGRQLVRASVREVSSPKAHTAVQTRRCTYRALLARDNAVIVCGRNRDRRRWPRGGRL
jgi:hypothetical protein